MENKKEKIILASKSPRRKELIAYLFDDVEFMSSNVEEVYPKELSFDDIPAFLSVIKRKEIAKSNPDALVIGINTVAAKAHRYAWQS